MTIISTIMTALIAGGIAFLLGWVVCKAVLMQRNAVDKNKAESETSAAEANAPVQADAVGLQQQIRTLYHEKAELSAKNSRYEDRINEQVRMLANLQEDRDRIRVEHGSQKRLIQTLQQTGLNKDQARQNIVKQQQAYEQHILTLQQQVALLEKTSGKAPVPSMMAEADGISLRDQLTASKATEASLKSQLQALQDWAKPLAIENTHQAELIERLKYQIGALRNEQQKTEDKLKQLSAAVSKAKVSQRYRDSLAATATLPQLMNTATQATERSHEIAQTTDTVLSPQQATGAISDPMEETHTDLPAADDLKKIRGIGPGLERRLHAAGIFSYAQLAGISSGKLQEIAARTKKAHRAAWANEAQRLHEAKHHSRRA